MRGWEVGRLSAGQASSLVDTGAPAFLVILPGIQRAIVEEYRNLRGEASSG